MNISAIIDTSTAAATAESVRFIVSAFNHTAPCAVKPAEIADEIRLYRGRVLPLYQTIFFSVEQQQLARKHALKY